jgi:hypothetical protein
VLKNIVDGDALDALNNQDRSLPYRIDDAINNNYPYALSLEIIEDWIAALKSGKKIVNPLLPREEFFNWYSQLPESFWGNTKQKPSEFVDKAIEFISKEFHGVETWIGGDSNA